MTWAAKDRVVFVADDGSGRSNLYSLRPPDAATCAAAPPGSDVQATATKHTARSDFCVRYPCADAAAAALNPPAASASDDDAATDGGGGAGGDGLAVAYCTGGRLFVSRVGEGPAVGVEAG